jgi:hypothetical protein
VLLGIACEAACGLVRRLLKAVCMLRPESCGIARWRCARVKEREQE